MEVRRSIESGSEINGIKSWHDSFKPIFSLFIRNSLSPILEIFIVAAVNGFSGFRMREAVRAVVTFVIVSS